MTKIARPAATLHAMRPGDTYAALVTECAVDVLEVTSFVGPRRFLAARYEVTAVLQSTPVASPPIYVEWSSESPVIPGVEVDVVLTGVLVTADGRQTAVSVIPKTKPGQTTHA